MRTYCKLVQDKGSIIIGGASAVTEKEDTTKLWQICLRRMSERGLQVLYKKGALSGIKLQT